MKYNQEKISSRFKAKFIDTISLPQITCVERIAQKFWKTWKRDGVTLSMRNSGLFITADDKQLRAKMRAIIDATIRQEIIRDNQMRNCRHSKHINQLLRRILIGSSYGAKDFSTFVIIPIMNNEF